MKTRVVGTSYGAPALQALSGVVAAHKAHDTMAPVIIVVPTNLAGIVARRHLARGLEEGRPGIAGVEVTTLRRLAERLTVGLLGSKRPTTRPVLTAAYRRALDDDPGIFRPVAGHTATLQALARSHDDLRVLNTEALDAIAAHGGVSADLVRLHRTVVDQLAAQWFDEADVLGLAGTVSPPPHPVVLYLPQRLADPERRFLDHISSGTDVTVVAGTTGAEGADAAILGAGDAFEPVTATEVLNASDSDDEVRCVVRAVVETLRTTPAHRVAVLHSAASPYPRLLHEQLLAAGITVNGAGARPPAERAVPRLLLEVLALTERDVPRSDLFRALSNAPVRDFSGDRIPLSSWERLSRSAGVVAGDDWEQRLSRYAADERAAAEAERAEVDRRDWLLERRSRQAARAEALARFAQRLRHELRSANELTSWTALSDWALDLLTQLVGDERHLQRLPEDERYAAGALVMALRSLASLDGVRIRPSLALLRDILEIELVQATDRVGRFGDGVLVAPVAAAIGLDADVVFVVGLAEDLYPGRLHEDVLLPDDVRRVAGGALPLLRERVEDRHRHLLASFAAAPRVVATFPRGDLRRSSQRLPSRWLMPTLRRLADDATLQASQWEDAAEALRTVGSHAGELLTTDLLATEQEYRVRAATASGDSHDPIVMSAQELLAGRAADRLTRYDGLVGPLLGLPDYADTERVVSATALESYARCPHAFFVERLLGVEQVEQPEDIVQISAMESGNLVHEVMDRLVQSSRDDLPGFGAPWTDVHRARALRIAEEVSDDFERRGVTGHERLWRPERARILADLLVILDEDSRWRARHDARVAAAELPFGMDGVEPVEVTVPSGRVRMRGRADKVDLGRDGTIHVTDIKTGSASSYDGLSQEDPVAGGTKLQLPVYAYAARRQFGGDYPGAPEVRTGYWFVRKDPKRIELVLDEAVERTYARTLDVLVTSIRAGLFPAKAPESDDWSYVQCPYCNPDGVGHKEARSRWERKRYDAVLASLIALVEPATGSKEVPA